jgi:hypothetical protein
LKKLDVVVITGSVALALALGCSSAPEEPSKADSSASSGSPTDESLIGGPSASGPVSVTPLPAPTADERLSLSAAANVIDVDDQLPVRDPVFAVFDGAAYTGDASVVITQASARTVSFVPSASLDNGLSGRSVAQQDSIVLAVRVARGNRQLSFTIPLQEFESRELFSRGKLVLGDSSLASLLGFNAEEVFRVVTLAYERRPNGVDQITARFAPIEQLGAPSMPSEVTFTGSVHVVCLPAAPAGQVHSLLDDPMLRSPFCQAKVKAFGLHAFAP